MRDVDCDFRLMRRAIFETIDLEKTSGVICLEMMKKIEDAGFRIVEVPVHHYHRAFGKSQFFNFRRIVKTGVDVLRLWYALVIRRAAPAARRPAARGAARRCRARLSELAAIVTGDYREFYRGRAVMITGGLGFIGSNLARAPGRARRRRAARRLADPRLRRQPVQHRRHRRSRARQRRRHPAAVDDELSGPRTATSSSTSPARSATSTACAIRTPISRSTAAAS